MEEGVNPPPIFEIDPGSEEFNAILICVKHYSEILDMGGGFYICAAGGEEIINFSQTRWVVDKKALKS